MAKSNSGGGYRSAISGRYVTEKHGKASPHTTVCESPGQKGSSGERFRSATTGQYVTDNLGERNPRGTVKNK